MATETRTEHPHIVRVPGVAGGRPVIRGTRISVDFVVRQLQAGDSPDDIVESYPHMTPAAVHDAISYYYDHQADVDRFLAENTIERLAEQLDFEVDDAGRITFR